MSEIKKYWWLIACFMYVMYCATMWKWGIQDNMSTWMDWSKYIYLHGFTNVYDTKELECNYLPAYLYILWFHTKIQGNITDIQDNLYTIKFYTLLFDFLGAYLAVRFVKDDLKKMFYFIFLLLDIAYIYNTVQWGQVDAIHTFFGFAAIIAALEKRISISVVSLLIALNFKLQAIVFIPIVGLLLLPQILNKKGVVQLCYGIAIGAVFQLAILLPFILQHKVDKVWYVLTHLVGQYPLVTVHAYNSWFLFFYKIPNIDIEVINDTNTFLFLTYKQVGNLLFIIATLIAILPLLNFYYKKLRNQNNNNFYLEKVFLISAIIPLCFFYFNTEMHHRYSHPMLISLAAYTFCSKRMMPLLLGSLAYFLQLERLIQMLALRNYGRLIFNPKFIACLFGLLVIYLFYLLYTKPSAYAKENMITV